jgi:ABC-type uncharacterized transport system auxiliary subunit
MREKTTPNSTVRRWAIGVALLLCAVLAAGCVSARSPRYYTISVPRAVPQPAEAQFPVTLVVGRLYSPHLLRDDRVVYGMSDVELGVDEYHRWAEPPTGMIERLLTERLRTSGRYRAVQHLSSTAHGDYLLRGYLGNLNEVDDPAGLKARFALQLELVESKGGMVVWSDSFTHDEPVPQKTVTSVVESLEKGVNLGIDQLTSDLAQYFSSHPPASKPAP